RSDPQMSAIVRMRSETDNDAVAFLKNQLRSRLEKIEHRASERSLSRGAPLFQNLTRMLELFGSVDAGNLFAILHLHDPDRSAALADPFECVGEVVLPLRIVRSELRERLQKERDAEGVDPGVDLVDGALL